MMVLCSFFPRADSGPGGLNVVLRIKVILLNPFPPVLRHFSKSRGASVRPFPQFESPCAYARFYIWHFLVCFSIMRCVLPRLPSVNGVPSGLRVCNSKRTPFRAGTAGAFRVAASDVTQTPPAPAGGGAERSRRRANGAGESGERRGRGRGVPKGGSRAVCAGAQLLPKSSPFFFFSRGLLRQSSHFFS